MGNKNSGTPKAALLKLDGTQIDLQGKITETDFFKFLKLPAEHYANLEKVMTPEQALKFRNHIVRMRVGTSAAIPMKCGGGAVCPVKDCPFDEGRCWPISDPCPLEANLIAAWTNSYVEDLGIDVDSRTEMVQVNTLVECDIIDYRANLCLSSDQDAWKLLRTDIFESEAGSTETINPHPILEIKERVQKRRQQILNSFVATRETRYKKAAALKRREDEDMGQQFSKLKKVVETLQNRSIDNIKMDADKLIEDGIINADWETIKKE